MERTLQEVESSVIESVGFTHGILYIKFHADSLYAYYDVPYFIYTQLLEATSVGSYYNEEVKGEYESSKID